MRPAGGARPCAATFPAGERSVAENGERLSIEHESFELPCGHYTTAKFPFNWMDGLRIARFLRKHLAQK